MSTSPKFEPIGMKTLSSPTSRGDVREASRCPVAIQLQRRGVVRQAEIGARRLVDRHEVAASRRGRASRRCRSRRTRWRSRARPGTPAALRHVGERAVAVVAVQEVRAAVDSRRRDPRSRRCRSRRRPRPSRTPSVRHRPAAAMSSKRAVALVQEQLRRRRLRCRRRDRGSRRCRCPPRPPPACSWPARPGRCATRDVGERAVAVVAQQRLALRQLPSRRAGRARPGSRRCCSRSARCSGRRAGRQPGRRRLRSMNVPSPLSPEELHGAQLSKLDVSTSSRPSPSKSSTMTPPAEANTLQPSSAARRRRSGRCPRRTRTRPGRMQLRSAARRPDRYPRRMCARLSSQRTSRSSGRSRR